HKSPLFYENLFSVNLYIDRPYAPIETRAAKLVEQEEAALKEVSEIVGNLQPPLSQPVAEVESKNFAGFATYLRGDVVRVLGHVGDAAFQTRFQKANDALAKAADRVSAYLKKWSAVGDSSHVLGELRYKRLLDVQEGLSIPLADFERMNED